ncbi:MAG: isoamylase early set domain-containing protein [Melioribacteraceae bacterium]|nr:isoamylase early set domain-containing protein [Melioribacteraceae bacterium]
MTIRKQFLKTRHTCKVEFTIPSSQAKNFSKASVVGDFNNWNANATPMKRLKKDGSFSCSVELPEGKEYQFRYLIDGSRWVNDNKPDNFRNTIYNDAKNCVIKL